MNMRIQITITNQDGQTEVHPIDVEAALPETGDLLIDNVEQAVIRLNKAAIRAAIVQYLEELSKKKPEMRKQLMAELSRLMPSPTESKEN